MYLGVSRLGSILNFAPKNTWTKWTDNFFVLLKYDYSTAFLVISAIILTILIFIPIIKKYLEMKKIKLPFFHIYNVLNGNTSSFFIKNRIKINDEYFEKLKLILEKYDSFIYKKYWADTKKKFPFSLTIVLLSALLNILIVTFGLLQINSDYFIPHLTVSIYIVLLQILASYLNKKLDVNKYFIENINYKQMLDHWKDFNTQLSDESIFTNFYNAEISKNYNNKIKLFFIETDNKFIKVNLNKQSKNYDQSIFKTKDECEYFSKILPWDLISIKNRKR